MSRRFAARLFLALACARLCAAEGTADLRFGFTPVIGAARTKAEFAPLMASLSGALGRPVVLYVAKDYGDLRTQLESGAVDIGSFSPFAYVDAERGGRVRIIAQSLIDGSGTYRGLIIARRDSAITSLAALAGRSFAYVDPKSASGYVYPRAMLIEEGLHPDALFSRIIFSGDHEKVIADVLARRADAGAVYDGSLRLAKAAGQRTEDLLVVSRTEPIPHDAIAVRVGLGDALVRRIQAALVNMANTESGRAYIAASTKGLSGFAVAPDSLYDPVRRTAAAAGL